MVHTLTPRLEYRVYLNQKMDYFDIIPELEMRFRQRFQLHNDKDTQFVVSFVYEDLQHNQKWLDFCKTKKADKSDYGYNIGNTWYDVFSKDYTELRSNKKLSWEEAESIMGQVDNFPNVDLIDCYNTELSGWYYNLNFR